MSDIWRFSERVASAKFGESGDMTCERTIASRAFESEVVQEHMSLRVALEPHECPVHNMRHGAVSE